MKRIVAMKDPSLQAHKKLMTEIERIVEQACAADTNIFGYGIWTHHILQVVENARRLASRFNADLEIVELAALLHDYASVKDKALYQAHHVHGPIEAEKVLRQFHYPQKRIEAIKHAIATHRASVEAVRRSPEAECLANADAITHIEQVPSLLYLAYVHHGMGTDEGTQWVLAKLGRSWKKLREDVQNMIREKYEADVKVLSRRSSKGDEG